MSFRPTLDDDGDDEDEDEDAAGQDNELWEFFGLPLIFPPLASQQACQTHRIKGAAFFSLLILSWAHTDL